MPDDSLRIAAAEVEEDRFSRFRLLNWWDQALIRRTNVLVVGAGALGNEILKNLALLGFERVVVVDVDRVELSNLSRSVLYREEDLGRPKSEAAAEAFRRIYPHATPTALFGNILTGVGAGVFDWADVILAGLDNREARLWINRWAWRLGRPWIDGAIEGLNGLARVFLPGRAPCYECTLGETDWQLLERRMSCNLLTRSEMEGGKVPTTPTTASVIAGIQVQEALKLLHGLPVLAGKAFVFDGTGHTSYVIEYTENPECFGHYRYERLIRVERRSDEMTLDELFTMAREELRSGQVVLEFSRDIIHQLECPSCGAAEVLFAPVGSVDFAQGHCPACGTLRVVSTIHSYTGSEPWGGRKLVELGLPPWDVFSARAADTEVAFQLEGDSAAIAGCLAKPSGGAA